MSTGVYYDDSYDRNLCPPGKPNCLVKGTEVVYDQSIDANPDSLSGGGHIDTTLLPLDPAHGNAPVWPHQFLQVNTRMNFQAVSVCQKVYGYRDEFATPADSLAHALDFVDRSLGKLVAELMAKGMYESTVLIVTAKHGQNPIDQAKRTNVSDSLIPALIASIDSTLLLQVTQDDIALLWLKDSTKIKAVADSLRAHATQLSIADIYAGEALKLIFPDPRKDGRVPDVVVIPKEGVVYTTSNKTAEHGGWNPDDINVPILLSYVGWTGRILKTPVQTTQVAPTLPGFDTASMAPAAIHLRRAEDLQVFSDNAALMDALGREFRLQSRGHKASPARAWFTRPPQGQT